METNETILEGNRVIAEFDGRVLIGTNQWSYPHYKLQNGDWLHAYPVADLRYHSSWDALMKVVEKLSNLAGEEETKYGIKISMNEEVCDDKIGFVYIYRCFVYHGETMVSGAILDTSLIAAVWQAVVSFITWYNTLSHTPANGGKE